MDKKVITPMYSNVAEVYNAIDNNGGQISNWLQRVWIILNKLGLNGGFLLDVGAGNCDNTRFWFDRGYKPICLDTSLSMLRNAKNNYSNTLLICGTYKSLINKPLFKVVAVINDVINYIFYNNNNTNDEFFIKCYNILMKNGVLIFDFLTPAVEKLIKKKTMIINNAYNINIEKYTEKSKGHNYLITDITINNKGRISKETHHQLLLKPDEICNLLDSAGFAPIMLGDLMMSGLDIDRLPSIDVIALKQP